MPSVLVDTAAGVAAALAAGTFSQPLQPVRSFAQWQTDLDLAEAEGLRVDIVPVSRLPAELETRGSIAWSPKTDIVIRKKFGQAELAETTGLPRNDLVEELVSLVEEIFAALVAARVAGDTAAWEDAEILAAYLPSHLRRHQFTAVIRITHTVSTDLP